MGPRLWLLTIFSLYGTKSLGPSFLFMKTLIQNLRLRSTTFNEFLSAILTSKGIGFLLKVYHGFSKQYHIFELRSLFATFESLKSVEFPMHTIFLYA